MDFFDMMILIFGAALIISGIKTVRKHATSTDSGDFEGESAVKLGWFWLALGVLFILSALFDIGIVKSLAKLFFEAAN